MKIGKICYEYLYRYQVRYGKEYQFLSKNDSGKEVNSNLPIVSIENKK